MRSAFLDPIGSDQQIGAQRLSFLKDIKGNPYELVVKYGPYIWYRLGFNDNLMVEYGIERI